MKIKYLKLSFAVVVAGFLLFGIQTQLTAQPVNNPGQRQSGAAAGKGKPKFAPGRFIVKFKSGGPQAVNEDVQYLLESNRRFRNAVSDKSDSLDKLKVKHKVKKARSVFIERRGLTTVDAKKKQEYMIQFSKAMHQFRSQRARKDIIVPDLSNIYVVEVPPESDIEAIVREFQADPHVEYAQPDYIMKASMVPNDPYYSSSGSWGQSYDNLWGLKKIQAEQAWDLTQGEGIVVAVVDTGLDYNHPDIAANVWTNPGEIPNNGLDDDRNDFVDDTRGWDFTICVSRDADGNCLQTKNPDNNPMDGHGHGTHVAGTIAAVGNNGIGIIGVAPKAKIMPLKGLEDTGTGYNSHLAAGIRYAALKGADVINNSWGCTNPCPSNLTVENAVREAYSLGAVVVFAAGNESADVSQYSPVNMTNPKPIVVSAVTTSDTPAYFTNFGTLIDVAAPGSGGSTNFSLIDYLLLRYENILSLRANNTGTSGLVVDTDYVRYAGTSMAAPHVAGVAALLLAYRPTLTNEEVRQVLRAAADDIGSPGFDAKTGAGRINAAKALTTMPSGLSDLFLSTLSAVTTAVAPGSAVSISVAVKNQGGAPAGSFAVAFSLSKDQSYSGSDDIALASGSISDLSAGSTVSGTISLAVPSTTPLGSYYICAKADTGNTVTESDEANNSRCTTTTIQVVALPDLVMTAVSSPTTATRGTSIGISNTVKNQGAGASASFIVGVYVSKDAVITTADTRVASRTVGTLAAGASSSATLTVAIPAAAVTGTYYIGAIGDYTNTIKESNETNNARAGNTLMVQ